MIWASGLKIHRTEELLVHIQPRNSSGAWNHLLRHDLYGEAIKNNFNVPPPLASSRCQQKVSCLSGRRTELVTALKDSRGFHVQWLLCQAANRDVKQELMEEKKGNRGVHLTLNNTGVSGADPVQLQIYI